MLKFVVSAFAAGLLVLSSVAAFGADSLSASAEIQASDDIILTSSTIFQIPYGLSQTTAFTVPDVDTSSGKLKVFAEGATCGASVVTVRFTTLFNQRNWEVMRAERDGSFSFTGSRMFYLQFDVTQGVYNVGICTFRVVIDGPSGGANHGEEELLGVISYEGGFASRLPVTVEPSALVKSFRVEIPAFCSGTTILEAGTISEGIFDRAGSDREAGTYSVNGGAGLRVSAIALSLNGPTGVGCTIPVYVKH